MTCGDLHCVACRAPIGASNEGHGWLALETGTESCPESPTGYHEDPDVAWPA